jgi:fatty acid desaturase
MKKTMKKQSPIYKRLMFIAVLFLSVDLGLLAAWLQPGAVVALLVVVALVALVLMGESLYLWQIVRMQEYNRKNRARRSYPKKEEATQ